MGQELRKRQSFQTDVKNIHEIEGIEKTGRTWSLARQREQSPLWIKAAIVYK